MVTRDVFFIKKRKRKGIVIYEEVSRVKTDSCEDDIECKMEEPIVVVGSVEKT
jgi:hypothetical protein